MVARQKVGFLVKNSLKMKAEYYKNWMITAMIIFGIVVTKENLARDFFIGDLRYMFYENNICVNENMRGEAYNMRNYHGLI